MKIGVRLFAGILKAAKQKVSMENMSEGSTVFDLLQRLVQRFGHDFQKKIFDEKGETWPYLTVLLNGGNIALLRGISTELSDGDVLAIFPPVAGGCVNIVYYGENSFTVGKEVYEPAEDTILLADNLETQRGELVLELGTGCGLLAILAAKTGAKVVATDINPAAIECASANAVLNGVEGLIDFRLGDLFEPVECERFDLVIFNPPYLPIEPGEVLNEPLDRAWEAGADGRRVIDRFLLELPNHLRLNGRALFVQSSLANATKTLKALKMKNFKVETVREKLSFEELALIRCFRAQK